MTAMGETVKEMELFREVLDSLFDGLYITDSKRRITFWNRAAERITGYSRAEVLGKSCADNILVHIDMHGENLCTSACPLQHTLLDRKPRAAEVFLRHKDGHRVPVHVRISPLQNGSKRNAATGAVEIFSDNTDKLDLTTRMTELEQMAMLDSLTGIGNRRHVEQSLENLLAQFRRYGWPFAVIFLDIDDFKRVNDVFSHAVGDKVLKMVASTLQRNLRSFDLLGRWGGEEFIIALANVDEPRMREIIIKLRQLVAASSFWIDEQRVGATVSAGATLALPDDTLDTLVDRADKLMLTSKRSGKNRVTYG